MGFPRSYDSPQAISVYAALEGTVVVRQTPARNPLGAGFGTVCIVGEPVNDQGSVATKTVVETLREITDGGQIGDTYGGFSEHIGSTTDGFEGNLAAALSLPGLAFRRLIIVAPDLEAGEVTFTRSAGGDEYTIPAGTRVSDGGTDIFLTLEDLTFAESGSAQQGTVRVRPENDATNDESIDACTTIVDTLDASVTGVSNAAALTCPDFDTQYGAAIALLGADDGLAAQVDIVIARRHTAAIRTALIAAATAASAGRKAFTAIYSPPIGTASATAEGSSGVGVGTTASRYKNLVYAWPNIQSRVLEHSASDNVDMHADIFAAYCASQAHPVENIGGIRTARFVFGLETGLDVAATQAKYQAWRALGIASPQIAESVPEILSDRTTELTAPDDELRHVRTVNWLAASLHGIGGRWSKKLWTAANRDTFLAEIEAFLEGLKSTGNPEQQLIEDFATDGVSGNTPGTKAAGVYVCKVAVTTLLSANTIVFQLLSGTTVDVQVLS